MPAIEIVIGVLGFLAIMAMAVGSSLLALVFIPAAERRAMNTRFPIKTKHGLRLARIPVRGITVEDVERAVDMFVDKAVANGYDRTLLLAEFRRSYLEFVRAVNDEGARYIVDAYGRKIAGDNDGAVMRVVVLGTDGFAATAGFHEFGHLAHETKGKVDYDHVDDVMWTLIVGACKKEYVDV